MTPQQIETLQRELEIDFAISEPGLGRFRVNIFYQRGYPAMVLRYITADMPRLDKLGLPDMLRELAMLKRGLVLMVGATGLGQVDHAGGDDQLPQRERLRSHRHDRGSDRVPAHQQALDRQPARSRARHQELRARAARRHARRPRRDPDRRNPRPREHAGGHQPGRHRPPGAGDAARQQLRRDARPHHQHVSARAAQADLPRPVAVSARDHGPAPGHRQRRQAGGGGRGHAQHAAHLRARQEGATSWASRRRSWRAASAACRASTCALHELYKEERITLEEALARADSRTNLEAKINFG